VTALTAQDRHVIGLARELAAFSADAVEQRGPHYTVGQAQEVIGQLLATIERLGGEQDQAAGDTRRLDRIRAVLAGFDWEHDDRQLALEAIERIADGGQA
jgi:hypothetical protein